VYRFPDPHAPPTNRNKLNKLITYGPELRPVIAITAIM
jgi:hypothetical protein